MPNTEVEGLVPRSRLHLQYVSQICHYTSITILIIVSFSRENTPVWVYELAITVVPFIMDTFFNEDNVL